MREFNNPLVKTKEIVISTAVRFWTPAEALSNNLGNLFTSADDPNKRYAVAVGFDQSDKIVSGALIQIDADRFESDEDYYISIIEKAANLLMPEPKNKT